MERGERGDGSRGDNVDPRHEAGARGEDLAARHLEAHGYFIRERNFRTRRGEIDLIAERGREIVFVEVRYRKSDDYGGAAASVDWRKRRRIALAAQVYLAMRGLADRPCRFDLVAITRAPEGIAAPGAPEGETPGFRIEHLENAFDGNGAPTGGWSGG